jgi:hypothetical protein
VQHRAHSHLALLHHDVCSAEHADGTLEYDAHNLFGTTMAIRHYEAFTSLFKKRPFMVLR